MKTKVTLILLLIVSTANAFATEVESNDDSIRTKYWEKYEAQKRQESELQRALAEKKLAEKRQRQEDSVRALGLEAVKAKGLTPTGRYSYDGILGRRGLVDEIFIECIDQEKRTTECRAVIRLPENLVTSLSCR